MSSESDDDMPLAARTVQNTVSNGKSAAAAARPASRSREAKPVAPKRKRAADSEDEPSDDSSDDDYDASDDDKPPVTKRASSRSNSGTKKISIEQAKRASSTRRKTSKTSSGATPRNGKSDKGGDDIKWTTLVHAGVLFPPEYEPHGVKMLYDGKPVDLTPEQEEVATMYAVMLGTEYLNKPVFKKNFWEGFQEVLGKRHVIQSLDKCDFTPIYDYNMAEREKKKSMSKEEKESIKKDKDEKEAKYKFALVDGRQEPVGNFRVEPPGLFRGRGEHPKMGKIKKRIYPRDITINIGSGCPIPTHPWEGQMTWKEVRHDQTVTWLAYWKDTISAKDFKYVWLGATSSFKADSDLQKYEKARKLKDYIGNIRRNYERDWESKEAQRRQMGCALYFIDILALRAGHEKDDDEADTVGCCTLKVENVELLSGNQVKFDFLGKDSIRYENTVEVHPTVYRNLSQFVKMDANGKKKNGTDQLFDTFDATDLNKELKNLMDGLSVKVFRTYNASITLDRLLAEMEEVSQAETVDAKKADYDKANKEVAILCNHQRSVPKAHGTQMEKMQQKLAVLHEELADLEEDLKYAERGKARDGKKLQSKESCLSKIEKKKQQIAKMEIQAQSKEDLKTVALNTSKINYMDPRITIAWCKRNEVPIEKVFNKSLMAKFAWAMEVEPAYRF